MGAILSGLIAAGLLTGCVDPERQLVVDRAGLDAQAARCAAMQERAEAYARAGNVGGVSLALRDRNACADVLARKRMEYVARCAVLLDRFTCERRASAIVDAAASRANDPRI